MGLEFGNNLKHINENCVVMDLQCKNNNTCTKISVVNYISHVRFGSIDVLLDSKNP